VRPLLEQAYHQNATSFTPHLSRLSDAQHLHSRTRLASWCLALPVTFSRCEMVILPTMTNFRTDFVANCRYICFTTKSSEDVDSCEVPVVSCISGVCGVGTRDPAFTDQTGFTKECDDGNLLSGDGCSNGCSIECGWECQGGALDSQDDCSPTACGDSKVCPTA